MAIISTLIGGFCGFITFLTALVFLNVGFLTALGLYVLVGLSLTVLLMMAGVTLRWLNGVATVSSSAQTYRSSAQAGLAKRGG
ncbi:hypothetical protein [uncultured Roseobacter sp.]|uniref:hypothetical protein n=1 Tax=uncultured Roseobacter sp. TaxID=114847 RepID=UPI00263159D2|nr:hypothetical protein [uncultured Roseobacter sp.]